MSQTTATLIARVRDQNVKAWTKNINISATQAGVALAAMGTAAFLAMNKLADTGAEIYDLASATGVSVEGVQALGYAFEQTGGSTSSMSGAIRGLNTFMRTAATGSAEYINVLGQLGIEYDSLRAMEPEQAFLRITDAIGGIESAMEKNIAATTIFGGRYAQQVTGALDQADGSLRNLTEQFEATGNAMSGEQISALKSYSDSITDLGFQFKKLAADSLIPIMPLMLEFLQGGSDLATRVGPEIVVVLQGMATTFKGLAGFIIGAVTAIDKLSGSADSAGGRILFFQNPVLSAASSILKFVQAAADADAALAQWETSADNAAASQQAAMLITNLYTDAMNGNEDALNALTTALEQLEAQGADTLGILENLQGEQQRLADIENALALETGTLTGATEGLTQEMLDTEKAAIDAAIGVLELENVLAVGPTVIAGQIAALQQYRAELENITFGGVSVGAGVAPEEDPELVRLALIAEKEKELELARKLAHQEQAQADIQAAQAQYDLERSNAMAMEDQQAAARQQLIDETEAANKQVQESIVAWGTNFALAMGKGSDGAKQWGETMLAAIEKIALQSAFQALVGIFLPGGGGKGGGIGGLLSGIFSFSGGGTNIPTASGGLVTGGRLGDTTLVAVTPEERILSRQQNIAYEKGMMNNGGLTVAIQWSPAMSSASSADAAQMVPMIEAAIRESGMLERLGVTT